MANISPDLEKHFNYASKLGREGRFDLALKLWNNLTATQIEESNVIASADFLGQVYMRKAWIHMDLDQFSTARETFESIFLKACIHQFPLELRFEYFFSYANTLGELGDIEEMENAFVQALRVAKHLKNARKLMLCWLNIMFYAEKHQAWNYLEQASRTCIIFSEKTNLPVLGLSAGIRRARALKELGKLDRAELQAKRTIQVARELNVEPAFRDAREFLKELSP